ncbi:MAG: MFS transporter [Delftia acidovorans]|jgi:predicted MFS family arabinose efflux permease|nr:MFS transporter [Delftia acidovorans]
MPVLIYVLCLTTFVLGTSEFMVAGMMPSLTQALGVPVEKVGHLISLYAAGMVVGGPLLTALLLRWRTPNKRALLWLLVIYAVAQATAAAASDYCTIAVARVVTGIAASACFGVSVAIGAEMLGATSGGRAAAIVLAGLMLAPVLGLPAATLIDQSWGWRASFWLVVVLAALCAILVAWLAPATQQGQEAGLTEELTEFINPHLWAAFATSGLIIGATFAGFSYFAPILTEVTGFSAAAVPWLLGIYGLANVVGNMVVGRWADRHAMPIMAAGLTVLAVALAMFALWARLPMVSVALVILIGLAGLPMNPAMVVRVVNTARPGPLVNTVHVSVINVGIAAGAWAGGLGISAGYGLLAPLWLGAALALLGLLSIVPYLRSTAQSA